MTVAITGAGGFIGRHLTEHLRSIGVSVREVNPRRDGWEASLIGTDVLVHLAGSAHSSLQFHTGFDISTHEDVVLAERLVLAAVTSGVRHIVHVSSVKAQGGWEISGESDIETLPADNYGQLKRAVETAIIQNASRSGLPVWITRLPLVYGPGVRANFLQLLKAVARGLPLPLGRATATRSYLGIRNLCSALSCCIQQTPNGTATIYLADQEPLSTRNLVRMVSDLSHSKTILLPLPRWMMRISLRMLGKGEVYNRLFEGFTIDSCSAREALGWQPPFTTREELQWTIQWYLDSRS